MKRHAFHREAEEEYADAAEYYPGIEPELGGRFYDEIERFIRDVRQNPEHFRLFDAPIRRHRSDVFPYAVLYADQPDRVLIVAVMLGSLGHSRRGRPNVCFCGLWFRRFFAAWSRSLGQWFAIQL